MSVLRAAADYAALTDTGRARRANEDALHARPPLFVVADGMGGAQAGEVASSTATGIFKRGLPGDGRPVEEQLERLTAEANARIHDLARADEARAGMGTTLTAAYVDADAVSFAHVGDSRAYLWRDGELERLTKDHSLVGEMVRRGKLTEDQAEQHPQRSIITRALGPEGSVEVDTFSKFARPGDVYLLCSDGLTSMVSDREVGEVLGSAANLEEAARRLVDGANAAGGRDNITVVLFRLEEVAGDGAAPAAGATASEQATEAGTAALSADDVRTAVAEREATDRSPAPSASRRRARAAAPPAQRRPLRARIPFGLIAAGAIVAVLAVGGWIATRAVFFVGTDRQGLVTVYRGLPYELPAGIKLYSTYYASSVPAREVPADRRSTLLDHTLRSRQDASDLVRQLELGNLRT